MLFWLGARAVTALPEILNQSLPILSYCWYFSLNYYHSVYICLGLRYLPFHPQMLLRNWKYKFSVRPIMLWIMSQRSFLTHVSFIYMNIICGNKNAHYFLLNTNQWMKLNITCSRVFIRAHLYDILDRIYKEDSAKTKKYFTGRHKLGLREEYKIWHVKLFFLWLKLLAVILFLYRVFIFSNCNLNLFYAPIYCKPRQLNPFSGNARCSERNSQVLLSLIPSNTL